jgi:hypothetical protein
MCQWNFLAFLTLIAWKTFSHTRWMFDLGNPLTVAMESAVWFIRAREQREIHDAYASTSVASIAALRVELFSHFLQHLGKIRKFIG